MAISKIRKESRRRVAVRERVSILICTYNYGRYLPQCLNSVLCQTQASDEVIVLDDGSTDETPEVIQQFPQVRYVYQQNKGIAEAFGRAVSLSKGDIICHLDADDYWMPGKLERVRRCFAENSSIGGVVHEVSYVDASGNQIHFPWESQHPDTPLILTLEECEDVGFLYPLPKARGRSFGVPTTTCVRRRFVEDLLPLPPAVGGAVDGIAIAAGLRYGMTYLPEPLAAYRIHNNNAGFGNVGSTQGTICMWEFLLTNSSFRRHLSTRHAELLRAKILERKAYLASRTGRDAWGGFWAGIRVPLILARNGYRCNWKHFALPATCLLPIRRTRQAAQPHRADSRTEVLQSYFEG
jgi:glycosyltransferase involved in cell wall biosynthesis